jgi:hypothetical protein
MRNTSTKTTSNALAASRNLFGAFFRQFPIFFFFFLACIFGTVYLFRESEDTMKVVLCLLVLIASLLIFAKNGNFAETSLAFVLGLLTVFSITWNTSNVVLFLVFYFAFVAMIFAVTAISLAAKQESILVQAANFADFENHETAMQELKKICSKATDFGILGPIEKAESIRFLSFMKIPNQEMFAAVETIEKIKIVYQVTLPEALVFYRSLFFVSNKSATGVTENIDKILNIPLTPSEIIGVLDETKKLVLAAKIIPNKLFQEIRHFAGLGYSVKDIISTIEESHN